jgi:hypothetical protein
VTTSRRTRMATGVRRIEPETLSRQRVQGAVSLSCISCDATRFASSLPSLVLLLEAPLTTSARQDTRTHNNSRLPRSDIARFDPSRDMGASDQGSSTRQI